MGTQRLTGGCIGKAYAYGCFRKQMLRTSLIQKVGSVVKIFIFLGVVTLSSPLRALSPAVALAWDPSPDRTVTGYNVYYGTASRSYTNIIAVGNSTNAVVSNLVNGVTYYFAATTYTAAGLESDYSAEAAYAVPVANAPPTVNPLPNLVIAQNSGPQTVPLSGITSGSSNETQTLSVSAFSSNPKLIPNPAVTYTSPNRTGTLTFTPATGASGSTIITVLVDDGGPVSNTAMASFTVTVVNNQPILQASTSGATNRNLIVMCQVGAICQVQYSTNLGPGAVWSSLTTYTQTNLSQAISVDPKLPRVFYRVQAH
jgi:hypothetical protein